MRVCLDPGHARLTAGKRSFDGKLLEYEFNRDVAKRMQAILEQHNIEVVYSCDPVIDKDTTEVSRVRNANATGANIFVSLHANAYGSDWNSANGWEIYVCAKGGEAEKLAKAIHAESIPYLGVRDRGVKENPFYVLTQTVMPAVLIEHAFYTNKEECSLLLSDEFREKCAIADANGILAYLNLRQNNTQEEKTSWAEQSWKKAVQKGVFDGTDPQGTVTREMLAVVLDRLNLL